MSFQLDSKSILVDALKVDKENFELSNLILPNKKALKGVYEVFNIKAELLEFAKDPDVGLEMLGAPPKVPSISDDMTEDEVANIRAEYQTMLDRYEAEKEALTMHVPYGDYMLIENFLEKFWKTLNTTPAIKGKRFYAFTKNQEDPEKGFFDALRQSQQN